MQLISVALLTALVPSVYGHYFWDKLIIDGKETGANQYVRSNTRAAKYNPIKWENVRDNATPDDDSIRCNLGAFESAGSTQTVEIVAGTKVGFKLAVGATMQHPGPALAYLSKAPSTAATYKGDGDWFKIWETAVCNTSGAFTSDAWCTWDKNTVEFDIPKNTPNGEYLLRVEHIGVHGGHVGQTEFYPACAQIKVTGGAASGTPGPTFQLPGGYKKTDPGIALSIYGGIKPYSIPGPAVWNGVLNDSGSNPVSSVAPVSSSKSAASASPATSTKATTSAPPTTISRAITTSTASGVRTFTTRRSTRKANATKAPSVCS